MTCLRSPIVWFGGKGRLAPRLLQLLPPHEHYVEPFGGGASMLLRKMPCGGCETYNDLDSGLANLFEVLADPELFKLFHARVALLPSARELFVKYKRTWMDPADQVERAARWFLVARQSFSGNWGNSWSASCRSTTNGMASKTAHWINCLDGLPEIHRRIVQVQIEHQDFRRILARYEGPGYLAYLDPPYVASTRRSGRYQCELNDDDHRELVAMLLTYRGAVVLSGYRSALYEPLEAAGWARVEIEVSCNAAGRTRHTGLQGVGVCGDRFKRTECIWLNPEAVHRHGSAWPELVDRVGVLAHPGAP